MRESRSFAARRGARWSLAALATGVLCAGAADRLLGEERLPPVFAHDEEIVFRFAGRAPLGAVLAGGIKITTSRIGSQYEYGESASGRFVAGRSLVDPATGRGVVVRPEALREYFQLVEGKSRWDADLLAERLIARVEKSGDVTALDAAAAGLRRILGPSAGVRLDDPATTAFYPPSQGPDATPADNDDAMTLDAGDPATEPYRTRIAGDDALWRTYSTTNDDAAHQAFVTLQSQADVERFFHPLDQTTGVPAPRSVLAAREHRRVLMRRAPSYVTFLPDIPGDTPDGLPGLSQPGYRVKTAPKVRSALRAAFGPAAGALRFVRGLASIDTSESDVFHGGTSPGGLTDADGPRVVNVTPPDGESDVDPTTDWEDPSDQFTVWVTERRPPVVRLRFARPLVPFEATAQYFTLTKTRTGIGTASETATSEAVSATVSLRQSRMGEVLVEIAPAAPLDRASEYEVRVAPDLLGLDGRRIARAFSSRFTTLR